jgi:hypothetical protein
VPDLATGGDDSIPLGLRRLDTSEDGQREQHDDHQQDDYPPRVGVSGKSSGNVAAIV